MGIIEGSEIGRQLEILDRSDDNFGTGRITLAFHASGKIPVDSDRLIRYNKMEFLQEKFSSLVKRSDFDNFF